MISFLSFSIKNEGIIQTISDKIFYSPKSRGKLKDWDHISKLAPEGWKKQNELKIQDGGKKIADLIGSGDGITAKKSKSTWERLTVKIYDIEPLTCPKCDSAMCVYCVK